MKIFIKHILRNLEEKIGRTLLITFTLMGVGVIVSFCFIMIYGVADLLKSTVRNTTFFDYMIYSERMPLTYEKLESISEDLSFVGMKSMESGYILHNKKESLLNLTSFDPEKAKPFGIIDQFDNYELKDNEALITKSASTIIGEYMGSKFKYYNGDGKEFELTIKYIDSGKLAGAGDAIFVNDNTYKKISTNADEDNEYSFFFGKYNGKEDIDKFNEKLFDLEDDYGYSFEYKDTLKEALSGYGDIFKTFILAIALGSVIVFFVLNSIVKIIMEERIPVVGSFRSVGASNLTMNIMLVCEMGVYGLIGGLIGSSLSASLLGSLFTLIYSAESQLGVSEGNNIPALMVIFTTLLMIAFQIVLSISEILSFNDMSIKECMFNSKQRRFKRNPTKLFIGVAALVIAIYAGFMGYKLSYYYGLLAILALFIAIAFILPFITNLVEKIFKKDGNPLLSMAFSTINTNKLQVSTNVIICILITLSISFISIFSHFVADNIKSLDYVKSDIYVNTSMINAQNDIMALDNVKSISTLYKTSSNKNNMKLANNPISSFDIMYSDNVDHLEESSNAIHMDYSTWKNLKNNEVILDTYYAKKYGLKVGDTVKLSWSEETKAFEYGGDIDLKVVAFANANILTAETAMKVADPGAQDMFINVKDKSKIKDTIKEIKEYIDSLDTIQTKEEFVKAKKTTNKVLFILVLTIIGFVVGVGVVGIINNQSVAFIERSKELAILYSTCMSRKQLAGMVLREIGISYAIAAVVSIGYGYILTKVLEFTCDNLPILRNFVKLEFNILWVLLLLVFIALILMIVYLTVKKKINKMNVVEELKYE